MKALLLLAALAGTLAYATADPLVVCYFSSWAVYRPGLGKFDVEDLDPFLCTHGVFGFAGLSNQTWEIEVLDPWNENCPDDDPAGNYCAFDRFVDLKKINPDMKAILAVGGWNEGSEDYSAMVADPKKRETFIDSCIELILLEGFDGLDIDWEYPTQRGGNPEDKDNFITLLDEFRPKFDALGLIMTGALASGKPTVDPSYDVDGLVRNLDVLSIMTYDYHGAWENFTHHNAPLCGHPDDYDDFLYFSVVFSMNYWIELGAPREKLVMGIPVYGRCFTLKDINDNDIWSPVTGAGKPGPYTRLPGTLGWNEICERLKDESDCTSVYDPVMYEPYMYCKSDKIWCGYDDEDSVAEKARFARRLGVAGIMVWTVDTDDFLPTCGDRKFGLINSMKDAFNEEPDPDFVECSKIIPTTPPTTTTPEPTTTTTEPTTTTTEPTYTTTEPTTTTTEPTTTTTEPTTTTTEPTTTTTEPTTTTTEPTTTTTEPTTTTTEPTTTTTEPTTTTTEPTTTTTEPTTTTTEATTTTMKPTTTRDPITTTQNPYAPPDCSADPSIDYYPHPDCNKYWWCVNGVPKLWLCAPGTYFSPEYQLCIDSENADTSNCNEWLCEADGDVYPGAYCDEYYVCEHGQPVKQCCPDGLYFNTEIGACDQPFSIDQSKCNVPTDAEVCTLEDILVPMKNFV